MSFSDEYDKLIDYDLKNETQKKSEKKETTKKDPVKQEETKKCRRSRSPKPKVESKKVEVVNYDIPSRQYGDLYCVVCDSHMNSDQMWESHIKGKRHIKAKNLKRADPAENKYEYCDEEATIQEELEKESRPIAGLDHICEILSEDKPPSYQCFLCSASLTTSKLLMEHIYGLKHQMAFLREHDKEKFALLDSSALSKSYLDPIIKDLMHAYQSEHGRGKMSVKKVKGKSGHSSSRKKSFDDDGDRQHISARSSRHSPSPKSSRYSPGSPSYSPPRSSKYSPPPKSSRYLPPPKSSRYSPPPKSSRYSPPPKTSRYSPPPKTSRYSSPPKSARMKGRNSESEWKRVSPVHERIGERRHSDRSLYPEEENWAKIQTEPPYYREAPTNLDMDTRYEQTNNYGCSWTPSDAGKECSDLRAVLEQKKSLGMTRANGNTLASAQIISQICNVPDSLLFLVNDMSPEIFLGLAVFKLEKIHVQNELEVTLLDHVADKAAALALDFKKERSASDLKAKYKETLAQKGISSQSNSMVDTLPQNSQDFTRNLNDLIGHYKARKTTVYDDVHSQESFPNRVMPSEQYMDNRSSHQQNSSQYKNSQERASGFDSEWNHRPSTSLPFQSLSSAPTYIPGLTLTEEPPAEPTTSTVLSQFAQTAKSIFGNISVPSAPSNSYQNDDYNRLNYRY